MTISADRALGDLDTVLRLREAPDLVAYTVLCEYVPPEARDRMNQALRKAHRCELSPISIEKTPAPVPAAEAGGASAGESL